MHGHGCQGLRCRLYLGGTRKLLTALEWGDGTEGLEDEYGLRAGIWREPDVCFFKSNWLWFFSSKYRKRGTYCQFPTRDMVYLWCFFKKKKKQKNTLLYYTLYTTHIHRDPKRPVTQTHSHKHRHFLTYTHSLPYHFLGVSFLLLCGPLYFFLPWYTRVVTCIFPPVTQA